MQEPLSFRCMHHGSVEQALSNNTCGGGCCQPPKRRVLHFMGGGPLTQGAGDVTALGHGLVASRPRLVRGRLAQKVQRAPSRCGSGAAGRAAAGTLLERNTVQTLCMRIVPPAGWQL
jgi:hypothetical protein